jgi:hypothetical protein
MERETQMVSLLETKSGMDTGKSDLGPTVAVEQTAKSQQELFDDFNDDPTETLVLDSDAKVIPANSVPSFEEVGKMEKGSATSSVLLKKRKISSKSVIDTQK